MTEVRGFTRRPRSKRKRSGKSVLWSYQMGFVSKRVQGSDEVSGDTVR